VAGAWPGDRSAVGTPLDASHVRRAFRRICLKAGIPGLWTPRAEAHIRQPHVGDGMAIEEISHLVGHSSTSVTETFTARSWPVIRSGADAWTSCSLAPPRNQAENDFQPGQLPTRRNGAPVGRGEHRHHPIVRQ